MKKLVALFLLSLIFSCGGNSYEEAGLGNVLENLTFSVDTVVIDRGEEIINLNQGINPSTISPDKNYFFHYTILGEVLSIIDLNELKLIKQQVFEKEGPNGIVRHTTNLQALDENQLLIIGLLHQGIYDLDGNKIKAINFEPDKITGLTKELEFFRHNKIVRSKNLEKYFSLPVVFGKEGKKILVVDIEANQGEVSDLPLFDFLSNFEIELKMSTGGGFQKEKIFLKETEDSKVIISNSAAGDVYLLDLNLDSLIWVPIAHTQPPNKKTIQVKPQVQSMDEYESELEKLRTQINYEPFLFDNQSGYYFRFAWIGISRQDDIAIPKADVYLFAYDQKLNLIGETKIKELTKVPISPFFKDGKLWSYVNVEDELGFAVMEFMF